MGFVRLILVGVFTGIYVRKLSKYYEEIRYLIEIKVTISNIARIINAKPTIGKKLSEVAYRKFIKKHFLKI